MKSEHLLVTGLAITAAVGGYVLLKKHHHLALAAKARHRPRTPGQPYQSRMAVVGRKAGGREPGVANAGDGHTGDGWSPPTAAGYNAHLNPGPWSYLTMRNENYTYAHAPTFRLLKPAKLGLNAQHKVQGSMGYTAYPWNAIYTYF